jgi:hypothetical protein
LRHTIEINHADGIVVAKLEGEATGDALHTFAAALLQPPFVDAELPVLTDMREISVKQLRGEDIKGLVQLVANHRHIMRPVRHAMVVSQPAVFGFARMYELLAEDADPQEINVFYDYDEAVGWLHQGHPVLR